MDSKKQVVYTKDISHSNVVYIRHGETRYNKDSHEVDKYSDMDIVRIKYNNDYLDCGLNNQGVEQSKTLQNSLNTIKLFKVYSSPLTRCLETCLTSLDSHPQKNNIEVIIVPDASELIHTIHDGCCDLNEKKKKFSSSSIKINWSLMDNLTHTYNYKFMDHKPVIEGKSEGEGEVFEGKEEEYAKYKFADIIEASFIKTKKRVESLGNAFKRTIRLKDFIYSENKEFIDSNKDSNTKILIFSHSGFIRISTLSRNYDWKQEDRDNDIYPEISYKPNNCEAIGINIQA